MFPSADVTTPFQKARFRISVETQANRRDARALGRHRKTVLMLALGMKKETTAFSSCGKLGLATKRSPAVEEGAA